MSASSKDSDSDPDYVKLFLEPWDTESNFVTIPQVLNDLVPDITMWLDETGLQKVGEVTPLQGLLADILQCSVSYYSDMIVDWIGRAAMHVHMIEKWLPVRGLTLADYLCHLREGGMSDGCELWCFSLAMNCPVTIVQEKTVWSMSQDRVDFMQCVILMTTYTDGFLCHPEDLEEVVDSGMPVLAGEGPSAAAVPPVVSVHKGRKLMSLRNTPSNSQNSTDPNEHMEMEAGTKNPPPVSGRAILCTCLVCDEMVHSGLALERHMRSRHPLHCPYECAKCDNAFNNLRELSSHNANQHTCHKVSCSHCDYCTVSWSWMWMHVRIHTRGIKCGKCQRTFPTTTVLWTHDKLHHVQ